tara:strand:+ start:354 stop:1451 length:1098 start_codon:yes stop_codon:yes gene_type:complete
MSKAAELAALIANVNNGSSLGNKNLVINGAMNVAQRGTVTGADDGDYGGPDRFAMRESSALVVTMSQDSSVPTGQGFNNSMKLDVTTADSSVASGDYAYLGYRFEGQDLQSLKKGTSEAVPVTLSFWIKTTITGTYVIQLYDNDTSGGRHISKSYTVSSADTWEKKTITFAGDTTGALDDDNAYSLQIYWWLLAGTDFTSGTLATSWASFTMANAAVGQVNAVNSTSNNIYITGVQLEIGEKATEFEHEPFSVTLKKCERYFEKTHEMSGNYLTSTSAAISIRDGTASTVVRYYYFSYKTRKRATGPTVTTLDNNAASGKVRIDSTSNISTEIFGSGETGWCFYPDTSISHYGINSISWSSDSEL